MAIKPVISPGLVLTTPKRWVIPGGYTQAPLRPLLAGGLALVGAGGTPIDPDAEDYFSRVAASGGTLAAAEETAVTRFVTDMKTAGIWSKMIDVGLFNGNFAAAFVKLKAASGTPGVLTNSGFTSGQFNKYTGLATDGINDLNTGVVPNAHGMTGADQSVGLYISKANGGGIALGAGSIYFSWGDSRLAFMSGANPGSVPQMERLMTMSTDTGNVVKTYAASDLTTTTGHSSTACSDSIRIGSYGGSFQSNGQNIQGYFLATGLTEAEVSLLSSIWDGFMAERIASARAGLVAFGDSITVGADADPGFSYAELLADSLSLTLLNSGISGTPLQAANTGVPGTNGRTSVYQRVSAKRPNKIAIQYGVNDINLTVAGGFTPAAFEDQLMDAVGIIMATTGLTGNDISIGSPSFQTAYAGDGSDIRAAAYAAAAESAATIMGTRFADVYGMTVGHPEYLTDGIHLNNTGHQVIANAHIAAFA